MRANKTISLYLIRFLPVVILIFLSFLGCRSEIPAFKGNSNGLSQQDLKEALYDFETYAKTAYDEAAFEISDLAKTNILDETNLKMKLRLKKAFNAMVSRGEPMTAFIETWGLCVRLKLYFTEGQGSDLYGPNQGIVVSAAEKVEANIEKIGTKFLKEKEIEKTRKSIYEFSRANPINKNFSNLVIYASEPQRAAGPTPFVEVLSIPMSPISAMKGVDRTATAIDRFTDTTNKFNDILESLPDSSRLQMMLLLYDLQNMDMSRSFLNNLSKLSDSSVKLSQAADRLPETLAQADKTTESIEKGLVTFDKSLASLESAAVKVKETAAAWESAAKATADIVNTLNQDNGNSADKPGFTVQDFNSITNSIIKTSGELRLTAVEFQKLLADQPVDKYIAQTSNEMKKLVDHIAWKLVQLILLVFVLVICCKLFFSRQKQNEHKR